MNQTLLKNNLWFALWANMLQLQIEKPFCFNHWPLTRWAMRKHGSSFTKMLHHRLSFPPVLDMWVCQKTLCGIRWTTEFKMVWRSATSKVAGLGASSRACEGKLGCVSQVLTRRQATDLDLTRPWVLPVWLNHFSVRWRMTHQTQTCSAHYTEDWSAGSSTIESRPVWQSTSSISTIGFILDPAHRFVSLSIWYPMSLGLTFWVDQTKPKPSNVMFSIITWWQNQ